MAGQRQTSDLAIAGEDLIALLERSGGTLTSVARRLEEEFADRFADGVSGPHAPPHALPRRRMHRCCVRHAAVQTCYGSGPLAHAQCRSLHPPA